MQSKLKLLERRITELEVKNAKIETEKAEIEDRNAKLLKQVMEKDAKRNAKNTELKSRIRKLEVRLAILEQGVTEATGQPQNDKDMIAEVRLSIDNPVLANDSIVDQQNSVNTKVIEDKKIDDYPEEPANVNKKKVNDEIRKRKREKKFQDDSQKELDSEILIASLDSATSLNEKNGQDYSSIANEQVSNNQKITYNQKVEQGKTGEVAPQSDKAFDIEISKFSLEVILTESSEVTAQNIVDLFRDVKSTSNIDDQSARTLIYNEIKALLPNITDMNLRQKTFRAKKIYTLFIGIGLDRIQAADNTDEVISVTNFNAHMTESSDVSAPIPSSHSPNFSGDFSKISPNNSPVIPYDARAPYINVALKEYPYLSLFNSDIHNNGYKFKNSGLCPECGKEHNKVIKERSEWSAGEYHRERTYRIICKDPLNHETPIVSVKA
ncbi:hypothetical protein C1645_823807 [Glomus cerebriforme]|uniref:Uncharacterized protein n=1 Tax=Glomus cerebriforme TaxID=658196 RepID=A0A397SZN6_9GLOM|nr:hypothetical protein C1645_823807 [Glomus cerebriforme]